MVELAKRTFVSLLEFIDQADNFINAEDMLCALTKPRKKELERVDRSGKVAANGLALEKVERKLHKGRKEEPSSRSAGYRHDRSAFSL